MKISIVTISYNQALFLERAIRSIVEQDHDELEYIVVDPGSTDGSRDIIDRYRAKIAELIYEPDNGPADGLNNGFSYATGEILGFINADDALLPGTLQKVSSYFEKNPEIDVVCGCGFIIDADGRIVKKVIPTKFSKKMYAYGSVTFLQQSTFFRKAAFLKTDGFNPENRTCWDGELLLDMAINGRRFGILYDDLAYFRIHGASISGSGTLTEVYRNDCDRLFARAMGREMNSGDKILTGFYRFGKWFMSPKVTFLRGLSRLGVY